MRGNGYNPAMNKSRLKIRKKKKKASNQQSRKTLSCLPYQALERALMQFR